MTSNHTSNHQKPQFDFLALRKRYRLTQAELAEMVMVSKNYICQIETGRKVPSPALIQLARRIERDLSLNPPLKNGNPSKDIHDKVENPAFEYLRKVWKKAEGDRHLQGYIITQLKLTFPLDKPPFT